uniref:Cytohesin 4 n=1 Tax=Mus musculus TaxID=10090 RepID=A0A2R8VK10_MOUSE
MDVCHTAGWRRKRRRCASGERNSTWTLIRASSISLSTSC